MLHLIVAHKEESADEDEASGDEAATDAHPHNPAVEIPAADPAGLEDQPAVAVVHPAGEPAAGVGTIGERPPATESPAEEQPVFGDGVGTLTRAARSRHALVQNVLEHCICGEYTFTRRWVMPKLVAIIDAWTRSDADHRRIANRMKKATAQLEEIKTLVR